ncbi:MAG: helix-turn-helix transcriptional regulator [Oscillospiraceae bacterium]|jgi:transcriptional regulator with XRE-family HTH domain|nr:helix-turn-helix transcriptional regulator [Oscillospiraceae bacterium]
MRIQHHKHHHAHNDRASTLNIRRELLRKELEAVHLQMSKIGSYIQRLRKSLGLTQGKLAETLSVSPQAVSNWERGDSLPDASQWIPLSQALGTSVELLLYGGELPEDAADEPAKPADPVPPPPAPKPVKPEIVEPDDDEEEDEEEEDEEEEDEEEEDEEEENEEEEDEEEDDEDEDDDKNDAKDPWTQVIELAPFISRETLDVLARKACEGERPDWDKLHRLAPFLSRESLREMARFVFMSKNPDWKALRKIAPFLGKDALSEIIESFSDKKNIDPHELVKLAPFLNRNELGRLLQIATRGEVPDMRLLRKLAPFLPRHVIDDYVMHAVESKPWQPKDEPRGERDRRGPWQFNWQWPDDASETLESVQREVTDAIRQGLTIGASGVQTARDAIRDALNNLFPDEGENK